MLGYGVTTYIVLPATIGAASCPRNTPVENVHATFRFATFAALISESPLYRVLAKSLAGRIHCPSSGVALGIAFGSGVRPDAASGAGSAGSTDDGSASRSHPVTSARKTATAIQRGRRILFAALHISHWARALVLVAAQEVRDVGMLSTFSGFDSMQKSCTSICFV